MIKKRSRFDDFLFKFLVVLILLIILYPFSFLDITGEANRDDRREARQDRSSEENRDAKNLQSSQPDTESAVTDEEFIQSLSKEDIIRFFPELRESLGAEEIASLTKSDLQDIISRQEIDGLIRDQPSRLNLFRIQRSMFSETFAPLGIETSQEPTIEQPFDFGVAELGSNEKAEPQVFFDEESKKIIVKTDDSVLEITPVTRAYEFSVQPRAQGNGIDTRPYTYKTLISESLIVLFSLVLAIIWLLQKRSFSRE